MVAIPLPVHSLASECPIDARQRLEKTSRDGQAAAVRIATAVVGTHRGGSDAGAGGDGAAWGSAAAALKLVTSAVLGSGASDSDFSAATLLVFSFFRVLTEGAIILECLWLENSAWHHESPAVCTPYRYSDGFGR